VFSGKVPTIFGKRPSAFKNPMEYKEEEIMAQLHDPATAYSAFSAVVKEYSEQLYWQIRRMVTDHDDANDLLQNTFLKAWFGLENFRGDSRLSTWLYRIAFNECLTFLSRKRSEKTIPIDSDEYSEANNLESDPYFNGDRAQQLLQEAIETLPAKQRMVFTMKYFEEKKYEEISEIVGTTVGALKASYFHAVRKIEKYIEERL
jgi:RNA polymerase sigma-70 factor (ECF subfamily)